MRLARLNPMAVFRCRKPLLAAFLIAAVALGWCVVVAWNRVELYRELSQAHEAFDLGQLQKAALHIQRCLEARPDDPEIQFLAARIERRSGHFEAAEHHLKAYRRLRGISDEYQTEWILLRAQAGESPRFEQSLWKCVKQDHPQSLEILETLAGCFIREGRFGAARTCLDEWLKRTPNNPLALEWRALTHENMQDPGGAADDYQKALAIAPERWRARLQLAKVLLEMAHVPDAARHLEILNKTHGQELSVQTAWAQCLFQQGKTEDARRIFNQVQAQQPDHLPVLYFLGKLEAEPLKAVAWYRKALALQPAYQEARFALYASLVQASRPQEAAEEMRKYQATRSDMGQIKKLHEQMEREPNNPEVLTALAEQLADKLNSPQAIQLLYRALAIDPSNQRARNRLEKLRQKEQGK